MIKTDLTTKSEAYLVRHYYISDWKDIEGIFEGIDDDLKQFGLELDLGSYVDDNYWFRIVKRKGGDKNV